MCRYIGYAFYDSNDGMLDVLDNEDYHPLYASVAADLGSLSTIVS